jgi:glycosyltransferase involved in cell wall biosynthesis
MKKTLTIGISAYNEETTIRKLLHEVSLQQLGPDILLEKILVISDGSDDRTVEFALSSGINKLEVLNDRKRQGLAARLNQILSTTTSDVLVILNADIRIPDKQSLRRLCGPVVRGTADLTASRILSLPAETLIERALTISMSLKNRIFDSYKNGQNVYTCHGPARAFSKALYAKLTFTHSVGEDAYSYLYCVKNGFSYQYVPESVVYYRLPSNLNDHQKQMLRFEQSRMLYKNEFGKAFLAQEYHLPAKLMGYELVKFLITHPLDVVVYSLIFLLSKITTLKSKPVPTTWDISKSSKRV